ncbi:rhamnan synthesis F family protein [Thalassotalea eurytherma]|uniref:Glycosyl transferase family 1 n=1 Tax=Thalassotalea eurytherma TaxID=1144278 RepID=A0ABQ6H057_9GAMM|nr:rhamnan synthesis F family protein [Thalassotalea eurytherma]GLX81284.1 hypothetical protein theurythT_07360 [Thalassotalea eurytherma]
MIKRIVRAAKRRARVGLKAVRKPNTIKMYKQAVDEGLFDAEYYQQKYGKFVSDYAAFQDYLAKSSFANVNPSSKFDTEQYLRTNVDVYHAGSGALQHYLAQGKTEDRAISNAIERWHPKNVLLPEIGDSWKNQKVALCLHIFYDDFIDRFATCIADFPVDVDVFLAVKDSAMEVRAKSVFCKLTTVKQVKTCVAANQGRNFGPMLVEFSDELLNYDLVAHAHSKKSLYSGREQFQWSDYLNQFLLKDRHVVANVLRLFEQNEDLGIYYPTSFWMMPSWVHNWTCNKGFAQPFVDEWELDISDNFLVYPVGGMFWAKPKALKQWLEKSYQYDNFPEEPLPADGSYLHAMERALGLLAEKNGYKQFFYYPESSEFTTDKSFIFNHYHKNAFDLGGTLSNFDIVSFDVFDTLLRRKYFEPDYAKFLLAKEFVSTGLVSHEHEFIEKRNQAEFAVRQTKNFQGDVSIYETYQELAKQFNWTPEQANSYADEEFEYDLLMTKPKDEMVDLANELAHMGKEIWLITDIYYTAKQVELMLKKIGLVAPYKLFVSSELGLRKDNTTMWHHVNGLLSRSEKSFIHVGDNVRSDAQLCGDLGLTTMHILNPYDKWRLAGFDNVLTGPLDEKNILKWGPLVNNFGRYPFFGEQ